MGFYILDYLHIIFKKCNFDLLNLHLGTAPNVDVVLFVSLWNCSTPYLYTCILISLYFQVEANGDILAEMILDDIIRDTAAEMENLEMMERAECEAIRLQDNPTLENVFQRLEQMEVCSHHSGSQSSFLKTLSFLELLNW